ncbi:MAG: biotin transporter BioY [Treponema sp.]|nr:biotin transporter BioY [Treponema sp.]
MSVKKNNKSILFTAFIALFAAIICIGCFLKIPLGPIPIVLQNGLCILTGVLMGSFLGGAPTALFLVAGLIGLPVYSGGTSGIAVWAGPTGGFLPGYLIGAVLAGFIAGKPSVKEKKLSWKVALKVTIAMFAGMIILYVPGIIHFARWANGAGKVPVDKSAFAYTMGACVIPYLPGDLAKIIVAVPVALKVRPILAQYLYDGKEKKTESTKVDLQENSANNQAE